MIIECEIEQVRKHPLRQPSDDYPQHAEFIRQLKEVAILSEDGHQVLIPFNMNLGIGRGVFVVQVEFESLMEKERRLRLNRQWQERRLKANEKEEQRIADNMAQTMQRKKMEQEYAEVLGNRKRDLFNQMMLTIEKQYRTDYCVAEKRDQLCYCEGDDWNLQQQQTELAMSEFKEFPSRWFGLTRDRSERQHL